MATVSLQNQFLCAMKVEKLEMKADNHEHGCIANDGFHNYLREKIIGAIIILRTDSLFVAATANNFEVSSLWK
jgi:hypothetical protein